MIKIRPQMQGEGTWGYRNSQIFQRGKASPFDFPLWPPLSLRRRRWLSLMGDPRPSTRHFFTIWKDSPCSSNSDAFHFMWKASRTRASVSNIYIFTHTGAQPMPSSWRYLPKTIPKTWKRQCGEKLDLSIFLYFLTRNPIFVLRKCARACKHFKITIKLFAFSNNKKKFLTYFLFVSLRVF